MVASQYFNKQIFCFCVCSWIPYHYNVITTIKQKHMIQIFFRDMGIAFSKDIANIKIYSMV